MSKVLLPLYLRLPVPLRSFAATLMGYKLWSWRYGPETIQLVDAALERESWSYAQWKAWQQSQLVKLLHRAATKVPFYRQIWEQRRRQGDFRSWEVLENWPVLEKESLRENPRAFVADNCDVRRMYHENTSGTTGKAVNLWFSRKTVRNHYALFEARGRSWYGVSRFDRWAIFGGRLVVPCSERRPPFWVWNHAMNQLYMSSYHLAPDLIPHYWKALQDYRIQYIWGYSSALYSLARGALQLGLSPIHLQVAITNSEPLHEYQRELIARAFNCPVRETYGMCETAAAASECEAGRLHIWPESGITEVFEGDAPVQIGTPGDLVCTGLLNEDMPLIRYRVGDRVVLGDPNSQCACGRNLPWFERIEGRLCDVILTADGRRIGRLDSVFLPRLPIQEAQIEQTSLTSFKVRYVPAQEFNSEAAQALKERLRTRLGQVEVILDPVSSIPRTANGKFRALICSLSKDQRLQAEKAAKAQNDWKRTPLQSEILEEAFAERV